MDKRLTALILSGILVHGLALAHDSLSSLNIRSGFFNYCKVVEPTISRNPGDISIVAFLYRMYPSISISKLHQIFNVMIPPVSSHSSDMEWFICGAGQG
jgi:hypothetical protein